MANAQNLLSEIAELEKRDSDKARPKISHIIRVADSLGDPETLAQAYYWLAKIQLNESVKTEDNALSLNYLRICRQLVSSSKNYILRAKILCLTANTYIALDSIESASNYWEQAYHTVSQIKQARKDSLSILASLYLGKAALFLKKSKGEGITKNNLDSLTTLLKKSYVLSHESGNLEGLGLSLRTLGTYDCWYNDNKGAEAYFEEALDANMELNSPVALSKTYIEMGKCSIHRIKKTGALNDFHEGISAYHKALGVNNAGKADVFFQLGHGYHMGSYYVNGISEAEKTSFIDSSNYYYLKGIDEAVVENNLVALQKIVHHFSNIYNELARQIDYKKITRKINAAYYILAKKTNGVHSEAAGYYQDFIQVKRDQLADRKQQNLLYFSSLTLLFFIAIFLLYSNRLRFAYLQKQTITKLSALQSQMNPHFISNSLSAIESLVQLNRNHDASIYLVKFSRLTRIILNHSQAESIPLREEIDMLKHYLDLEKLRMNDKLTFSIQVDKEFDIDEIHIPPMLIQPLVENAVWHGIKPKDEPGKITIQFAKENAETLLCIVEDDGIGRAKSHELKQESAHPKISHSTRIIQERIEMIKSHKSGNLKITDLVDEEGKALGTKAEMFIHFTENLFETA